MHDDVLVDRADWDVFGKDLGQCATLEFAFLNVNRLESCLSFS